MKKVTIIKTNKKYTVITPSTIVHFKYVKGVVEYASQFIN